MCRIVGGIDFRNNSLTESVVAGMRDVLAHGGPDSKGFYKDGNVVLAHRRLSIIEISESGNQPMQCGKWVISYNGEIYNYKEIRIELEQFGICFKTNSDTEVIVRAFEYWGHSAVDRFRGMFAFAIWDSTDKVLTLCRDRFGVKPLYWYYKDGLFMFSSELKAFHQHPNFDKTIDLDGIPHYLLKGYFQEKDCIFKYVNKVKPGTFLIINSSEEVSEKLYWDINKKFLDAKIQHLNLNEHEERLEEILTKSFSLRMVADVPVGIFLSGGIDSSLVTAIIQKCTNQQLHTFTIGFEDRNYDESEIAVQIAKKLGTKHETINCSEQDFKDVIPKLPFIYDEPFGDSSSIPTYLLSKFTSKSVKVALSGDGGDELFGGYSKYMFINRYNKFLKVPKLIRSGIQEIAYLCSPGLFEKFVLYSGNKSYAQIGSKYLKLRQTIGAKDTVQMFEFASSFLSEKELKLISKIKYNQLGQTYDVSSTDKLLTSMGYWDMLSYLPGDILTKVDRASMHNALETREPFLDPEILDFSFSIPSNMKISNKGDSKFLLKRLLEKYIPIDIINRPKYGFTIPIENWMRNHLNQEINEMLLDNNFFITFQLDQKNISLECKGFFTNQSKLNPHVIWFIYTLYKWYELWLKN